ncbi:MAG: YraN family protein [Candidatus Gottesmanbacteria bacterium]
MNNLYLGKKGEEIAAKYLQKTGYQILQRNFKCKLGEIDIIALDPSTSSGQSLQTLVFIEVKTRWSKKFGLPEEAVTPWKIRSIVKTGEYFKMLHPQLPDSLRIDVVAISISSNNNIEEIKLLKNITG